MPHSLSDLDPDRHAVAHLADKTAATCRNIRSLLEMREDDRAKAEFDALVDDVTAVGTAMHELLANRALFAKSDALEARAALQKMQEALHA